MLRRLIDRLRLPFRKDRELRSALFRILGFYPHHIEYYKIAFAHKSQALRDKNGKPLNNERLEFLGDAILESVVSDILYHHFEKRHEGFLTATRSKIVQRESLNRLAKEMGIDKLIQTSTRNHSVHSHLGGNAFEALMGAIYLDKGYKACQKFVQKQILGRLMDLDGVANKEVNFKSKLLEWCQKNKLKQDFVMRLEDNGKQKEPTFYCTVIIEAIEFGYGKGFSKKEAQQQAARETLTMLRRDENVVDSVFRSKEKRTAMEANEMAVLPKIDEIEDDLLREQQMPKGRVASSDHKATQPEVKQPTPATQAQPAEQPAPKKERKEKQPAPEQPQISKKEDTPKEQQPSQKAPYVKPVTKAKVAEKQEPIPAEPVADKEENKETPKKEKREPKKAPINLAAIAEAAIAEAEAPHLPTIIAPHSTAVVAPEEHSTAVVAKEVHSTAIVTTEPPRKREIVPVETVETNKQEAVSEAPNADQPLPTEPSENQASETVKKDKRRRHKVSRVADFTKTEVKSEAEVEAERQRIIEEREEKRRNKRVKREANRAKEALEELTEPQVKTEHNDILAEVSLDNNDDVNAEPAQKSAEAPLSNSAKRRLRRKRAAERAQQDKEHHSDAPEVATEVHAEEHTQEAETRPAERKKHQRGNSRKRRRQQATEGNTAPAPQAEEEV